MSVRFLLPHTILPSFLFSYLYAPTYLLTHCVCNLALVQLFTISATSQANSNSDISILDNISSTSSSDNLSRRVSSSIGIELLGSENSKTPHIQRFARPLGGITVALAIVVLAIGECFRCFQSSISFLMITNRSLPIFPYSACTYERTVPAGSENYGYH